MLLALLVQSIDVLVQLPVRKRFLLLDNRNAFLWLQSIIAQIVEVLIGSVFLMWQSAQLFLFEIIQRRLWHLELIVVEY